MWSMIRSVLPARGLAAPAPRHVRWLDPRACAARLPALGCVLYLPARVAPAPAGGLLPLRAELAPLAGLRGLFAASLVTGDGPREWLDAVDRQGRVLARLYLLPDTDYLAWDALLAAGAPGAAPLRAPAVFCPAGAHVLRFQARTLAGMSLLDARTPTAMSPLGSQLALRIAKAESVHVQRPLAPG
ncbi:hypothetical protein [Frateuria defendens]|uniref:hypothetical protein n=1 Tax=Frateuria defendens TaxID=2219559 RepID=UPI00066FB5B2|nr:hypothetical protein [Frateuria defendens]